jgi:hypothetical protein
MKFGAVRILAEIFRQFAMHGQIRLFVSDVNVHLVTPGSEIQWIDPDADTISFGINIVVLQSGFAES